MTLIRAKILQTWVKYEMFIDGIFVYECYLKQGDPVLNEMIRTYYEGYGFMGFSDDEIPEVGEGTDL